MCNPLYPCPRGMYSTLLCVHRSSSKRTFLPSCSSQENGLRVPTLGGALSSAFCVFLKVGLCVSVCVCLQKGVGLSSFSLPWKAPKAERVIHQPHPPQLGPAWARAERGKFFGEGWGWGWRQ